MASSVFTPEPNPAVILEHIHAYQRTACLRGAIDLELFTRIGEGNRTVEDLARACDASPRGVRILCDYLTIQGLLTKNAQGYGLTPDTAAFLDKRSPAYLGGALPFLNSPSLMSHFRDVAEVVRRGTTLDDGMLDPNDPIWVGFAKAMPALVRPAAEFIGEIAARTGPQRVLDIAAGHGLYGISIARRNPKAEIFPVDWKPVLEVARTNAGKANVERRYHPIPGSAFDVDYGSGYDTALVTNFLHHFDRPTCEGLLRKIKASLDPGGKVYTLEFVPNPDRVSPPAAASFSLTMLCNTPAGDAYTFEDLKDIFTAAGFLHNELREVPRSPEHVLVSS